MVAVFLISDFIALRDANCDGYRVVFMRVSERRSRERSLLEFPPNIRGGLPINLWPGNERNLTPPRWIFIIIVKDSAGVFVLAEAKFRSVGKKSRKVAATAVLI